MNDQQVNQGATNSGGLGTGNDFSTPSSPGGGNLGNVADNSVPQPDSSVPNDYANVATAPGTHNQQQDFGQNPQGDVQAPPPQDVNVPPDFPQPDSNQGGDFGQNPVGDDVNTPPQPDFSNPSMDNQQQDFGQNPQGDDFNTPSQPDFSDSNMVDSQSKDFGQDLSDDLQPPQSGTDMAPEGEVQKDFEPTFGDYMQPEQPGEQTDEQVSDVNAPVEFPNPDIDGSAQEDSPLLNTDSFGEDNTVGQPNSQFEAQPDTLPESAELPPQPQMEEQAEIPTVEEQFNQGTTSADEDQKLNPLLIVGLAAGLVVILAIIIIIILLVG